MQVYKFGGASVKDAAGVKNAAQIIKSYGNKKLLVVVSAMGKTTNALEKLAHSYYHQLDSVNSNLEEIQKAHFSIINELFENKSHPVFDDINNTFVEIEWIIEEEPVDSFDFIYDQIVSIGELLSSKIVSHYLNYIDITNKWEDARAYIQTDNTYQEGKIDWDKTNSLIEKQLASIVTNNIVLTQGFIGNTSENFTTTLGREGSDFSAAIFASALNAESLTVWKDVPGILNADPKRFTDTIKIDELSYADAIEITFYGATIIHPKTIKPLQNKLIPLYVKPFLAPTEAGTKIIEESQIKTPVIIVKENQTLISIQAKDYSFMTQKHLSVLFQIFSKHQAKINTLQISALSISIAFDNEEQKFNNIINELNNNYTYKFNNNLNLFTIRNYNEETINKYIDNSKVILQQNSRLTAQYVLKTV